MIYTINWVFMIVTSILFPLLQIRKTIKIKSSGGLSTESFMVRLLSLNNYSIEYYRINHTGFLLMIATIVILTDIQLYLIFKYRKL